MDQNVITLSSSLEDFPWASSLLRFLHFGYEPVYEGPHATMCEPGLIPMCLDSCRLCRSLRRNLQRNGENKQTLSRSPILKIINKEQSTHSHSNNYHIVTYTRGQRWQCFLPRELWRVSASSDETIVPLSFHPPGPRAYDPKCEAGNFTGRRCCTPG